MRLLIIVNMNMVRCRLLAISMFLVRLVPRAIRRASCYGVLRQCVFCGCSSSASMSSYACVILLYVVIGLRCVLRRLLCVLRQRCLCVVCSSCVSSFSSYVSDYASVS